MAMSRRRSRQWRFMQMNAANPGMSLHKLDKSRDRNFWSVRVSSDIRMIVHRTQGGLVSATSTTTTRRIHGLSVARLEMYDGTEQLGRNS